MTERQRITSKFFLTKWRETEKCRCMFGAEFRVRLMKIKIKYETGDTLTQNGTFSGKHHSKLYNKGQNSHRT